MRHPSRLECFGLGWQYPHTPGSNSQCVDCADWSPSPGSVRVSGPAWIPCPDCEEFWCRIHERHTHECACPPMDEWTVDPYTAGGPE